MSFSGIDLPNISGKDLDSKAERQKILEYLYQLSEQLRYTLANLDEENLSNSLLQIIREGGDSEEIWSSIERSAQAISLKVSKGAVISEINQSAEAIKIKAEKIALEGMVTANQGFRIYDGNTVSPITGVKPVAGFVECVAGRIGCFLLSDSGTVVEWGSVLQIGNMYHYKERITGLKYAPNLQLGYAQLCMDTHGRWDVVNASGTHVMADLGDGGGTQLLYAKPSNLNYWTTLPDPPANP